MKIDWKTKLTSRKLWLALAGFISGLIVAFGGSADTAATVSGCIMSGASVVGYLLAEGLVDSASASSKTTNTTLQATTNAKEVAAKVLGTENIQ